jgi:hypothetical protein
MVETVVVVEVEILLRKVQMEEVVVVAVVVALDVGTGQPKDRTYYNSKTIYKIYKSKRVVNGKKY